MGQLIQDPQMQPFVESMRKKFSELVDKLTGAGDRLNLTFDDFLAISGGEMVLAVIQPTPNQMTPLLLVDVTGNLPEAEALVDRVSETLTGRGAKRSEVEVAGVSVVHFELPLKEGETERRIAVYFLHDDLLAASDNLDIIADLLSRRANQKEATRDEALSLADHPAYQSVMARCQEDVDEWSPQVRWFIEPFGYIRAMLSQIPEEDRARGKPLVDVLSEQGFTAVQGVGGFVDVSVEDFEVLHRTAVLAPKPFTKAMRMLKFPNSTDFAPQPWLPRDVASCTTFYFDVLNAFDHIGPLFDELVGQGEEGVWEDVLDGLENDPDGPQINLRGELISQLDNRITMITDYVQPITTTSERLLFAIKVKDVDAVAGAIAKTLQTDPEVERREFGGHIIWETVPREAPVVPSIQLDLPPLGFDIDEEFDMMEEETESEPLLPNASFTVAHGYLLIASHYEFLTKMLEPAGEERKTLAGSIDYRLVQATAEQFGDAENCVKLFSRTDEEYRPIYELIRQGKMPEAETMLARVLNTLFGAGKEGVLREQQIDGSTLPEFDFVRRFLGPAGLSGTSEEDGWFFRGFLLEKP